MTESGSMCFNGRRCGSLSLYIKGPNWAWAAETLGKNTLEDAIFDAHYKLDECVASRSPVEVEIAFLSQWLQMAEALETPPAVSSSIERSGIPEATIEVILPPEDFKSGSTNKIVPISSVEFSTLDSNVKMDDMENSLRLAGMGEEVPEINEPSEDPSPLTRK